ncbi:hypothetical protein B0T20DRAFT_412554 [Sordaria brevicollis]|uniref:Uncharacterized protein n=1 Tax=Sordaria brevicollis TaxID=83679 RepID=A0AAE0PCQ4_SORBR|nr:hypothetical protein B0T20DRAFT_412554 [Sordaria brevicollis]
MLTGGLELTNKLILVPNVHLNIINTVTKFLGSGIGRGRRKYLFFLRPFPIFFELAFSSAFGVVPCKQNFAFLPRYRHSNLRTVNLL